MKTGYIWNPTIVTTTNKPSRLKGKPSSNSNSNSLPKSHELKPIPEYPPSILTKKPSHSKNSSLQSKKASESKENSHHLANLPANKQTLMKKSIAKKVTQRRTAEIQQAIFEEFNESQDETASNHRFSDIYKPSKFITSGEEDLNRRISLQSSLNSQSTQNISLVKPLAPLSQEPKPIMPARDKSPNHQRFNSLAIFPRDYSSLLPFQPLLSDKAQNGRQKQPIFPNGPSFKIERAHTEEDESYYNSHWRDTNSIWSFQQQYKAQKVTIQQKVGDDGEFGDGSLSPSDEKPTPKIIGEISIVGITPLIADKRRLESCFDQKTPIGSSRSRKIRGLDSTFQVASSIASDEFKNVHHPVSLVDALNKQSISPKLFPGGESFGFRSHNNPSGKGKSLASQNVTFRSSALANESSYKLEGSLREKENGVPKHPKPDFYQTQMPECRSVSTHITGGDTSHYLGDESFDANINAHQISHNYQDGQSNHTNSYNNFFSNSHLSVIRAINLNCEESLDQVFSASGRPSNLAGSQKIAPVSKFSTKTLPNTERISKPKTLEEQLEEFGKAVEHIESETDLYRACQGRVQEYTYDCYYFQAKQKEINASMRSILIDWMIEVSAEFHLKRDTLYLAQYYIDLYLSNTTDCKKSELQLVGVTCLFIASKIEEIIPRKVKDFARATDDGYTIPQILDMEQKICKALSWRLNPVTLNFWMNFYSHKWDQFVSSSPLVAENKMINPERDLIRFRDANEYSYLKYRELIQIADTIILNSDYLQHDLQMLSVAILFIIIGREFGQFSKEEITTEIPYCSDFIFHDRQGFYKIFAAFTEQSLNLELFDLLETIQFSAKHFRLLLNYDLPLAVKKNAESLMQDHYEEFLTYQTHNLKSLETVRVIMNEK